MNIKFDFTETGGLPLDQDILNDLQNGTLLTEQITALFGSLVIISGCVVAGGSVGNGVVAINGEVLPFVGAPLGDNVIIVETDTNLTYFDGVARPSQKTRMATFGDDGVQFNPWADFLGSTPGILTRLNAIEQYWQPGDIKEIDCTEAYIAANFDGTGLGINLRVGWAICNGNNGTVNRLGRTPVQRDPAQAEFAAMGDTGGEKTHILTVPEIPSHSHVENASTTGGGGVAGIQSNNGSGIGAVYLSTEDTGGGEAHNNLQPYITTLFIQKL